MIAAAAGAAIVAAAVEPKQPQYWLYLAAAGAITAQWARSRTALAAGLVAVGLLGVAGGAVWSAIAAAIPFAVAIATAVRTSPGLQILHVAVVAVGSFAALLVAGAAGAQPMVSMVIWSVVTAGLVAGSHRLGSAGPQS